MKTEMIITHEGEYVQIISNGEKNYEFAQRVWSKAVETCRKHECFKILGIANSTKPIETLDGYDHARLFRDLEINRKYRIAWVERNPEFHNQYYFVETVLVNRGVLIRLFSSVSEAKEWLLDEHGT